MVWGVPERQRWQTLDDHTHYVQGVAWDPKNNFVVTQSVDRSCRVYARSTTAKAKAKGCELQARHIIARRKFPVAALPGKAFRHVRQTRRLLCFSLRPPYPLLITAARRVSRRG